jgi:uncharacterized protein (TIRG00374 family)
MRFKFKITFQGIIYILLIGAFAYWTYSYRDQLVQILSVIQQGVWYIILATMLVLGIAIYNQATLYTSIYEILDLPSTRREMLPLYLVRRFVQVAAPSGGFSGWVPFLQFARRRDIAVGAVFIANLIYTILWYTTFFLFLLLGLLYLFLAHDLQWFEISAGLVILAADVVMIAGLVLAWIQPQLLERILAWLATALGWTFVRLKRKPPLTRQQIETFGTDLTQAVALMRTTGWSRLLVPVVHALLNETLHIFMFYLVALAFGLHISVGILVPAYSISVLFFIVSPTPGGLGFVEGTLILVLTTLGVPADQATVVTLAYRGITFWMPFVLGFVALRWFNRYPDIGDEEDNPPMEDLPAEAKGQG